MINIYFLWGFVEAFLNKTCRSFREMLPEAVKPQCDLQVLLEAFTQYPLHIYNLCV